ncbi:MAG: SpoIID/LytB domain-containing protein [Candidatus Babeliales bacterium]|jgi:stage II sporulation protein D (peptidoglycan lytic transglycosylase)
MKNQWILIFFLFCHIFFIDALTKRCSWPQGIMAKMQGNNASWFITTQKGFVIQDMTDQKKKRFISGKTMVISCHKKGIAINGIPLAQTALVIMPCSKLMNINAISYQGRASVIYKNGFIGFQVIGSRRDNFHEKQQCFSLNKITQSFSDLFCQSLQKVIASIQEAFDNINQQLQSRLDVRVLLSEHQGAKKKKWHFFSSKGFILYNQESKKKYWRSELAVSIKRGNVYIDDKVCPLPLYLTSLDGTILFNDATYHGSFVLKKDKQKIQCINYLDIENYVFSVLRTESWPGWPVEINKALAIASRSYVIAQAIGARKNGRLYDVKNTNEHQTYNGIHTSPIIKQAVKETKGMLLGFNNEPIMAMFDSCCGGIVPAGIADIDFAKAPYLARDYACTFCKNCKIYTWQASYEHTIFEKLLRKEKQVLDRLKEVKITKKDKAGLVSEVLCKGAKKWVAFSGKKLYSLFKEIKSFCFTIKKEGNDILVKGRGFGHHLGLCQWGAREMVRNGWDYKRILQFYYPKTQLMHLT